MARYRVQSPDGRIVTLEGDTPPTEADLDQVFASLGPPKLPVTEQDLAFEQRQQHPVQTALRDAMQTHVPDVLTTAMGPAGQILRASGGTVEGALETAPAAGATVGGVLGGLPGATIGGAAGEAGRQLVRNAAGLPIATGVVQRALGLDPNSPVAAATGIGAEAAVSPIAAGLTGILGRFGKSLSNSSLRSLLNLLQPKSQRDLGNAMELAKRMETEGVAPALSGREAQLGNARSALDEARNAQAKLELDAITSGGRVPTQNVVDTAINAIPENLAGVQTPLAKPLTGRPIRKAAEAAASDVLNVATSPTAGIGPKGTDVPLETALAERRRLDKLMRSFYEGGRENVPQGVEFTKKAADAWRAAISTEFPELGKANIRTSELITITELLDEALRKATREGGLGTSAQEAAAVGAGAVGRMSIPAMLAAKAGVTSGPFASLSAAAKRALATVANGGAASTQAWLRLASQISNQSANEDTIKAQERNRRAHKALQSQGAGVTEP